jgi:dipeptidase E
MSIILLSNTYKNENQSLLGDIKYLVRDAISVAYIPSAFDRYHDAFYSYVEPFLDEMNLKKVEYLGLEDADYNPSIDKVLDKCSVIFLGGGNTFHFLYWLRKRNLLYKIKELSKSKIIIGVSAGALLLTPNISLSGDKNLILPSNDSFDSIGLTKFYIKPHFTNSLQNLHLIEDFRHGLEKEKLHPIYGIQDDGGIIVESNTISTYGKIRVFYGEHISTKGKNSFLY